MDKLQFFHIYLHIGCKMVCDKCVDKDSFVKRKQI